MAFPTTGILDNFDSYAVGGLNGLGNWVGPIGGFTTNLRVGDNAAHTINPSAAGCNTYESVSYGPDCEAYADIVAIGTTTQYARLYARMQNPTGTTTQHGYMVEVQAGGAWTLYRIDSSTTKVSLGTYTQVPAAGDKFGIECVGSTINAWWYNHATSTWTKVITATDATYSAAGVIAVGMQGSTGATAWTLDNVGGGTSVSGSTFNDSPSGTIVLSGSIVESAGHGYNDSPSGSITLSGSLVESVTYADSPSGTIQLTGGDTESGAFNQGSVGTFTLSGSLTEGQVFNDQVSGTLAILGAIVESHVNPTDFTLVCADDSVDTLTLAVESPDSIPLTPY